MYDSLLALYYKRSNLLVFFNNKVSLRFFIHTFVGRASLLEISNAGALVLKKE